MAARSYDAETTKGGHADLLPVADELVPWLEEAVRRSPSKLVFPRPDGSMHRRDIDRILRRALRRAGVGGGATFSGSVPVQVSVSDASAILRVELRANVTVVGTDFAASWAFTWATGNVIGPVSLVATAKDAAGNVGTSAPIQIVVRDVAAPSVALSSPVDGAHVAGTVTLTAAATDDVGVARVEFFVDGTLLTTDAASPWTATWDASALSSTHVLTAKAVDASGNARTSSAVSVVVDNVAPTVALTAPAPGAVLAGVTTLSATASDDVAVARVDFYVGGTLIGSATAAPFTATWDTTTGPNVSYSVQARAIDAAGNATSSTPVTVTVANPDPETAIYYARLRVPACGAALAGCSSGTLLDGRGPLGPEANAPNTIGGGCGDGTAGSYHADESLDGLAVATLDGSNLAPGKQVRITAKAWIYSTSFDRLDLFSAAAATSPSWTYLTTVTPTATGLQTMTATYTLPAGGPLQAIRGVLRYRESVAACGAGSYTDHDDLVFAVAQDAAAPTVTLTSPAADSVLAGMATLTADAADNVGVARVDFYAGATLIGSAVVAPYSVDLNTATLPNGTYTLLARAVDLAGNSKDSANVTVSILNVALPFVADAIYDPTLGAPTCGTTAFGCTTGTLVDGRGPIGPEPGQPNTIRGTCADGGAGTYHVDESLDALTVWTVDDSALASGKTVRIAAKVWVYSKVSDRLDLYYASDASSPDWSYIETLTPDATGAQTLETTFTLPVGGTLRAIRGVFRYGGVPGSCGEGSYDDHDDLVFATDP